MKPAELIALCDDAIARWKSGEMISDEPKIMLVVPTERLPKGPNMRLFGRKGPVGRVAQIKEVGKRQYEAVGYWPAIAVRRDVLAMTAPSTTGGEG